MLIKYLGTTVFDINTKKNPTTTKNLEGRDTNAGLATSQNPAGKLHIGQSF